MSTTSGPTDSQQTYVECPKCGSVRFYRVRTHVEITVPAMLRKAGENYIVAVIDWPHEEQDDTKHTKVKWICERCQRKLDLRRFGIEYDD